MICSEISPIRQNNRPLYTPVLDFMRGVKLWRALKLTERQLARKRDRGRNTGARVYDVKYWVPTVSLLIDYNNYNDGELSRHALQGMCRSFHLHTIASAIASCQWDSNVDDDRFVIIG